MSRWNWKEQGCSRPRREPICGSASSSKIRTYNGGDAKERGDSLHWTTGRGDCATVVAPVVTWESPVIRGLWPGRAALFCSAVKRTRESFLVHEVYALKLIQIRVSRSRTYGILEAELLGSFANMRSLTPGKNRRKTYLTYGTINTCYPRD